MKNFVVELPEPEVIDGKEVGAIEFREPYGEDLEEIVGVDKPGRAITELAAKLAINVAITPDDVRRFKGKNYLAISKELVGFLG